MNYTDFFETFRNCENSGDKVIVKAELYNTINYIKNTYHFDILKEIITVDNNDNSFELIYNLFSTENNETILLSYTTNDYKAESVSALYESVLMDENEIYDLFGINFVGNDKLKRLYMPEGWEGHPLQKKYSNSDNRLNWND